MAVDKCANSNLSPESGPFVNAKQLLGLGRTYRVSLSLRLAMGEHEHLLSGQPSKVWVILIVSTRDQSEPGAQVRPFRFELSAEPTSSVLEKTIHFKLSTTVEGQASVLLDVSDLLSCAQVSLFAPNKHTTNTSNLYPYLRQVHANQVGRRSVLMGTVNIATC